MLPPRKRPEIESLLRLSGMEAFTQTARRISFNIGERTNVTGSPKFSKLILGGDYEGRSSWPASRLRTERRSSILIWTKACSTELPR
jgi:cobalamin-dependent methionine synthase I